MFPPKKAAEILNIPDSTLRRYRQQWADYLSAPDEKRRYTQEDINTIRLIRDLIGQRYPQEEIAEILLQGPEPFVPEDEIPPGQEPQAAIQSIEFFSQVIDQMADQHKSVIMAKDETITGLKKDKDRLQNELSWMRLPWYKKLFRDPPE